MRQLLIIIGLLIAQQGYGQKFQLVLDSPLREAHSNYEVKGRQGIMIRQKLSFGNYETREVKRGALRSWVGSTGIPGLIWEEHMEGRQSIRFRLTDGLLESQVVMVTYISRRDLKIGSDRNSLPNQVNSILTIGTDAQENNLSTAIYIQGEETPWELYQDNTDAQLNRGNYTGYVVRGEQYYQIVPVWEVTYKDKQREIPFGTAGFEIQDADGKALAAVSLMDSKGIVYLGNLDPAERFLMANVCATLLLQEVH